MSLLVYPESFLRYLESDHLRKPYNPNAGPINARASNGSINLNLRVWSPIVISSIMPILIIITAKKKLNEASLYDLLFAFFIRLGNVLYSNMCHGQCLQQHHSQLLKR